MPSITALSRTLEARVASPRLRSTSPSHRYTSAFFGVFFFQAEDGIRDLYVTGVQTCALPISTGQGREVHDGCRLVLLDPPGDRKSVVGKSVDLGGRRIIKKKKKTKNDIM